MDFSCPAQRDIDITDVKEEQDDNLIEVLLFMVIIVCKEACMEKCLYTNCQTMRNCALRKCELFGSDC